MTTTNTSTETAGRTAGLTLPDSRHGDLTAKLTITHLLDDTTGTLAFEAQTASEQMVECGVVYCEGEDKWDYSSTAAGRLGDMCLDLDEEAQEAVCLAAYDLLEEAHQHQQQLDAEAETAEVEAETITALVITAEGVCLAEVQPTSLTRQPDNDTWLVCQYPAYQQETIRVAGGAGLKCWLVVEWLEVPEVPPSDAVPTMWLVANTITTETEKEISDDR